MTLPPLPPLPAPAYPAVRLGLAPGELAYTAAQLRAYAAAAVAAERERCATLCEDMTLRRAVDCPHGQTLRWAAAAIRAQAPSQAPTP